MRYLITGALGQLGRALQAELLGEALILVDLPEVDVSDREAIFTAVAIHKPDIIIHCAAYTNVDGCAKDPQLAYKVNGLGTQNVALACQKFDIPLVHVSTNEVFSGERTTGYEEWMPLNPINAYGRSKAAAETYVRTILNRYYIVRTAWLYAPGGRNFIHTIYNHAKESGNIRVVTDEIGNPTYVVDLAQAIVKLLKTEQFGTYHFVNAGACSRWEFANEILRLAGLAEQVENRPILSSEFQRASTPPPYGEIHNIAGAAIGITLRPWQAALSEYVAEYVT